MSGAIVFPDSRRVIQPAVMRAILSPKLFSKLEVALLEELKCPDVIDFLEHELAQVRSRNVWLAAAAAATSAEPRCAALLSLKEKLENMTDADFDRLVQWDPMWASDIDDVAVLIKQGPFDVKALSIYKPEHMAQTITSTGGRMPPVAEDAADHNFLHESAGVDDCRKWFYPATVGTLAEKVQNIECGIRKEAIRLGLSSIEIVSLESRLESASMTKKDEESLMCELHRFFKHGESITKDFVSDMIQIMRLGIDWRNSMLGNWEGEAIDQAKDSLDALPRQILKTKKRAASGKGEDSTETGQCANHQPHRKQNE
jgi:hypothetical protein